MSVFELTEYGIMVKRGQPQNQVYEHIKGDVAMPYAGQLEQDLVWIFPELGASGWSVEKIRNRVRWQWYYLVGVIAWRSCRYVSSPEKGLEDFATKFVEYWRGALEYLGAILQENRQVPSLNIVSGLTDMRDDIGPGIESIVDSIVFGLRAEFQFSQTVEDRSLLPLPLQVRYQSWQELLSVENRDISLGTEGPLNGIYEFYCFNAWDMYAIDTGGALMSELNMAARSQERRANAAANTLIAFQAYQEVAEQQSRIDRNNAVAKFWRGQ